MHVQRAIHALTTQGFLILCNQQNPQQIRGDIDKIKNEIREDRIYATDDASLYHNDNDIKAKTPAQGSESKKEWNSWPECTADTWMALMTANKHWDKKVPKNWRDLLVKDFENLDGLYEMDKFDEILAYTQFAPGQASYNASTHNLIKNHALIEQFKNDHKKKNPDDFAKRMQQFYSVMTENGLVDEGQNQRS